MGAIFSCLGWRCHSWVELTREMSQFITIPGGSRAIVSSFLLQALIRHENTLPCSFPRPDVFDPVLCGASACHTCVLLPLARSSCPFGVCLRTHWGSTTTTTFVSPWKSRRYISYQIKKKLANLPKTLLRMEKIQQDHLLIHHSISVKSFIF